MSVQFGRWNFDGHPPAPDYIDKVSATLAPYGPDSNESYAQGCIKILYRAFHTTKESHLETQPHISASGAVITWDGRLDNRPELISELRSAVTMNSTDVAIVAAAYEKWGAECFAKLIGDWALSIWNSNNRSLLLVKDPVGTHHLYYSLDKDHVTWSTILDPLVLFAGKTFSLCEEYIAGCLSDFPATHLTPYVGIDAVPPSSSVLLRFGKHGTTRIITKYWDFDPGIKIRYRTSAEYEEHFRTALATAIQCRLRCDRPVLAELSGGMDSSSIVCMADTVIARRAAETPRLDTISWFDDSDPNDGERAYFTKVEEKRGREGCHIDLSEQKQKEERDFALRRTFASEFGNDRFAPTPFPTGRFSELSKQYAAYMISKGHRVVLSGIGGDEATGNGVPTPTPEFQNLLARARFVTLVRQLNAWAAKMRKPRLPLLWEAVQGFLPLALVEPQWMCLIPWLDTAFVCRNRAALSRYPRSMKLFGPLPSFQDHIAKLDGNKRFQAQSRLPPELLQETRFPYLDRHFLEFMFAIPREQIVRVGQRRSLMKRALVGIVPDELLNRKRTLVSAEPAKDAPEERAALMEMSGQMLCGSLGYIDPSRLLEALRTSQHNQHIFVGSLMRTLRLEFWLRHLVTQGIVRHSMPAIRRSYSGSSEQNEETFRVSLGA